MVPGEVQGGYWKKPPAKDCAALAQTAPGQGWSSHPWGDLTAIVDVALGDVD